MEHWGKPNLFFLSSSELQHAARQKKATRWSTNAIFFLIIALSDNKVSRCTHDYDNKGFLFLHCGTAVFNGKIFR